MYNSIPRQLFNEKHFEMPIFYKDNKQIRKFLFTEKISTRNEYYALLIFIFCDELAINKISPKGNPVDYLTDHK
ncbi:hypothetical protein DASC09_015510 [Saccharomycopsis crataegensis]|uniref:Homing endonuclease LAGLIDADG domain-containing protein n=1 Tax=Saccharomycopsis crataegensis TaxID=43959 RepID=A0AAV5QHS2_9ASCO|nr:hypothetical protein DASC09_015510 [Saccharomycopsis crataegensis]